MGICGKGSCGTHEKCHCRQQSSSCGNGSCKHQDSNFDKAEAISLVKVVEGIDERFDELQEEIEENFAALQEEIEESFEAVHEEIEEIEERITRLEKLQNKR